MKMCYALSELWSVVIYNIAQYINSDGTAIKKTHKN